MPGTRLSPACGSLILIACATTSVGQSLPPTDGEPVIVGAERPPWKSFELARFAPAVELFLRSSSDTLKSSGEPDTTDTETRLQPSFIMDFQSYIGHKNLLDVTGQIRFALEQRWIDNETLDVNENNTDTDFLYDISGLILGTSKTPVTIYTRRQEQYLDRDFSTAIDNTVSETGVRITIDSEVAPTFIHMFYNENTQDDRSGNSDYSRDQGTISVQNTLRFAPNHRLETNYTFDDIDERLQNSTRNAFERNDLLLTDIINFGSDHQHEARTYLRYYDQTGDFGFTSLRLEEQIRLEHSRTLESRYNVRANWVQNDGVDQDFVNGFATILHRLFDSLVSTGTVGGDYFSTSEDFESSSVYGNASFYYTKLAGPGRIDAGLGGGINAQHNSERGSDISVFDDPKVYLDPAPITVDRRNVVVGSVNVTGPGGFPTYVEGIDYDAEYYPDRVEIRPILGGAITNGTFVLVDYVIGPEPASDIDTYTSSASARYTFTEGALRGFSVYASYRNVNNNVDAVDPSLFAVDDSDVYLYGAEYRRDWLTLRAEREERNSTQNPYDATRLQAMAEYLMGPGSRAALEVDYELQDLQMPENQVNFLRVSARWNERWNPYLNTTLRFDYREEQDDLRGDTDGVDAIFEFNWSARQTTIFGTLRATLTDTDQTDTESQYLEFGIRRDF